MKITAAVSHDGFQLYRIDIEMCVEFSQHVVPLDVFSIKSKLQFFSRLHSLLTDSMLTRDFNYLQIAPLLALLASHAKRWRIT